MLKRARYKGARDNLRATNVRVTKGCVLRGDGFLNDGQVSEAIADHVE